MSTECFASWLSENIGVSFLALLILLFAGSYFGSRFEDIVGGVASRRGRSEWNTLRDALKWTGNPYYVTNYILLVSFVLAVIEPSVQWKNRPCSALDFVFHIGRNLFVGGVLLFWLRTRTKRIPDKLYAWGNASGTKPFHYVVETLYRSLAWATVITGVSTASVAYASSMAVCTR